MILMDDILNDAKWMVIVCNFSIRQIILFMLQGGMSGNFQRYINQIQQLRKQVSGQKLAHENTLKQLQSAYQIIDEIKDALRYEQNSNSKLKAQLNETTINLSNVAHQYEAQIAEVKELLTIKDEELRRINSYLRVNDADIIRMKVVNELQLENAEKLEALNVQIVKKSKEMNELRSSHQLLLEKHELMQREMRQQQEQSQQKNEKLTEKYMEELKHTYQQLERQRSEHSKWAKKHQMLQQRFSKQADLYRNEVQKLTQELHDQNKSLLSNSQAKLNKHKVEKLEDSLSKLKQELASEKESSVRLEDELTRTRKECKGYKSSEHDLMLERERCRQQIEQLKRELAYKDVQHKKNIETVQKQMENKADNASSSTKDDREKIQRLQSQLRKLSLRIQQLQSDNEVLRQQAVDKNLGALKKELSEKEDEIDGLRDQLRALKKKEGERKRTVSVQEKKDESLGHYKTKLQEANGKIVELLREKIQLKQEITALKGK